MAQIVWTVEAQRWLEDIFGYIAADNPRAATETVQGIYDRAQALSDFPEMGYRYVVTSTSWAFSTAHWISVSTSCKWHITTASSAMNAMKCQVRAWVPVALMRSVRRHES